ncbi:MAG: hypothetical protein LBE91_16950 [Tannerella sp.]|jgi:hypothetical protein|nr:hypothetical protein [Tannerella sp.]
MTKKYCFLFLIAGIFCLSCGKRQNYLEETLQLAGDNRPELEKVLAHYRQNPADSLKYKAAVFLIENMDTRFFLDSPELDAYYRDVDSIFSINGRYVTITGEQDSLLNLLQKPDFKNHEIVPDLQHVSAGFLMDNIDRAFEAWQSPFARGLSFDDFCEFLLPYKVNAADYPASWRSEFYNTFYPYVKFMLDTSCRLDSGLLFNSPSIALSGNAFQTLSGHIFDTAPDFTVSCWINLSEYKPMSRVFDFGTDSSYYICFIPYSNEGNATLEIRTGNAWEFIHTDPLPLNGLSHLAVSYSRHCVLFYVNGLLVRRVNVHLDNRKLVRNFLGKSNWNFDTNYLNGTIRDFRIYGRELTCMEVCDLAGINRDALNQKQKLQEMLWRIRDISSIQIIYEKLLPGGYDPVRLINLKKGTCNDYTVLGTYIFRSLGIPSGMDFVPQWADRSMGHDWNIIYTGNSRMEDYSFSALWDTLGNHLKSRDEKIAKVFRYTYAKQPDRPVLQNGKGEILPPTFRNPCIKDVTDSYLDCMDITVSLTQKSFGKRKYAYLCNFNNHDWIPVHWGKIKANEVVFTKMGKNVAYLPVYFDGEGVRPAAPPFILTAEGEIKKLIPDHSKTQTVILKRKYKPGDVPKKGELLVGSKFQVANKADFSDSLTVYEVNDVPEILYNPVDPNLSKPYRYFRFVSASGSRGGEISEIEVYSNDAEKKLSGMLTGNLHCPEGWEAKNAFDGDPLTSYMCEWGEEGLIGLDFGKPVNIDYFRYLPRNDDNFIREGEEYELFYWDDYQWNSLGRQTGTSRQYLEYANAPLNALFWLRNLTKGKEERIFTYENGQQVWW